MRDTGFISVWSHIAASNGHMIDDVRGPYDVIPRLRDATELNNDGMIKFVDVHYQTEPNLSFFPKEIWSAMTPVSVRLFFQQLTCSVMFLSVPLL